MLKGVKAPLLYKPRSRGHTMPDGDATAHWVPSDAELAAALSGMTGVYGSAGIDSLRCPTKRAISAHERPGRCRRLIRR